MRTVTAIETEPSLTTLTIVGDLGLIAGGVASEYYPMSRGRTILVDLGGILGFLAGGAVALGSSSAKPLLISTALGLGLAVAFTSEWDAPEVPLGARLAFVPMGRQGWGASLSLDLDL